MCLEIKNKYTWNQNFYRTLFIPCILIGRTGGVNVKYYKGEVKYICMYELHSFLSPVLQFWKYISEVSSQHEVEWWCIRQWCVYWNKTFIPSPMLCCFHCNHHHHHHTCHVCYKYISQFKFTKKIVIKLILLLLCQLCC